MTFRLISHAPMMKHRRVLPVVVDDLPAEETMPLQEMPAEPVEAPLEALVTDGVATAARPRRRARKLNGEFRGDDLATPDVNEAYVEEPGEN